MVGCQRSIGRASRQANGSAAEISDIGIPVIPLNNSANKSDVVAEARQDEIGVVVRRCRPQHRPTHEDVVAGKGHEHGVFDVVIRSEEHTSELQSQSNLVCRLLLEKKKKKKKKINQS